MSKCLFFAIFPQNICIFKKIVVPLHPLKTNDFVAAGGDTYYAFGNATDKFDTGLPLDEVLMDYITKVLGGVIGGQYAQTAGRITIIE